MTKKIMIYALSTCIWCKKTIAYFKDKKIAFDHVFVDLLSEQEYSDISDIIEQNDPGKSFPLVIIGDRAIVGYSPEEFEECLNG